jgi:hypothetical protein
VISQWTWNLRRELGHQLKPQPLRTTEFAPAIPKPRELGAAHPSTSAPEASYGPPVTATRLGKRVASLAQTFLDPPDGTLRCPAGRTLVPHERRREGGGSLRVVYAASIRSCRPCPLRKPRQWQGRATKKPEPA